MQLNYSHKPNYFFYAQRLMHLISQKITQQSTVVLSETFSLSEIYTIFSEDFAASTVNLEGILNIVEQYYIGENPAHTLIASHHIDAEQNTLALQFDANNLKAFSLGAALNAPDAAT